MRHLPFFEELAAQADDQSAWTEHAAGVLVLRFFESWFDCPAVAEGSSENVIQLRTLIAKISNPEARQLLKSVVSSLVRANGADPSSVAGPLLAYARYLEESRRYPLAIDVLTTVANAVDSRDEISDRRLAAFLYLRLGILSQRAHRLDAAEEHYGRTIAIADALADVELSLEAGVEQARVWLARGNIGDVEKTLAPIIDQAKAAELQRVEALGRRVRGTAMQRRGRPGDALREFHAAYMLGPDETEREYLLGDIAACTAELGLRSTARIVHQTLALTGMHQTTRSIALLNLMEIAVLDDDRTVFQSCWDQLEHRDMPQEMRMHARLYHAQGVERWEATAKSIEAYKKLAEDAAEAGVRDIEFYASEALQRLEAATPEPIPSSVDSHTIASPDLTEWKDVTDAIETACHLRLQMAGSAM